MPYLPCPLPPAMRLLSSPPSPRSLVLLAAVGALTACGDPAEPSAPTLASLIAATRVDSLPELDTRRITVQATGTDGLPYATTGLVWQSSDTSIVTVAATGDVTGVQPGRATVTASLQGKSLALAVRVLAVPVHDVTVRLVGALAADTMLVGTSAPLIAEARDIAGRTLRNRQTSFSVAESSTQFATVDGGRLTGREVGVVQIVAYADTVERRLRVVVRPALASGLTLRLADPKKLGDTSWVGVADSAIVAWTDASGATLPPSPLRPASYSSDDTGVATVSATGRVTLVGPGTATIRANGDRLTAARSVLVVRAPIVTVIAAPDTVRVLPGESATIRPLLIDGGGIRVSTLGARAITFASLTPSIATVDANGVVQGVAVGTGSVRVVSERGTATVPVRVVAPAGSNAFVIDLRFVGPTPSPEVLAAFEQAKARWQGIIRQTTGSASFRWPQGTCLRTLPTAQDTVRDVVIMARIDSIDGPSNILGSAGPCVIKPTPSGHSLPIVGQMVFDSADMKTMATTGRLVNVITHEMGHVLGVGTMWAAQFHSGVRLSVTSQLNPSTNAYLGTGGIAASATMGFTQFVFTGDALSLNTVPLEDTGGSGTAGSHWRRSIYGNELMNGFAGSGAMSLSLLTVAAMADLGYTVTTTGAEPWGAYILGGPSASSLLLSRYLGAPAEQLNERLLEPVMSVDRSGTVRMLKAPTP